MNIVEYFQQRAIKKCTYLANISTICATLFRVEATLGKVVNVALLFVALYQKCEIIYVMMVQSSHWCAVVNYVIQWVSYFGELK